MFLKCAIVLFSIKTEKIFFFCLLYLRPEFQWEEAVCGVCAVLLVVSHVEYGLMHVEGGREEVVRDLVLVGEDEVVEASLNHLQGHLKIGIRTHLLY